MRQRWRLRFAIGILAFALATGASARITMSGTGTIKGEVETWVDHASNDDIGFETTAEVTLDGEVILREEKVAWIDIAWGNAPFVRASAKRILLLAIYQTYGDLCDTLYRFVDLAKPHPPYVTKRFGNCRGGPFIREKGDAVILYFPRFHDKAEEAYRYTTKDGLKKIPVTPRIRAGRD